MPCAALRRPKGSFDPVGLAPMRKNPASVSILSASETIAPDFVRGSGSSWLTGR